MITFILDFPPSLNHATKYRIAGKPPKQFVTTYKSGAAKLFEAAAVAAIGWTKPTIVDRVAVSIELIAPNKRRYDIDNRVKPVLDAIQAAGVIRNDEQVDKLDIRRGDVRPNDGAVVVTIAILD